MTIPLLDRLRKDARRRRLEALVARFTRIYGPCPQCGDGLGSHEFLQLAAANAAKEAQAEALRGAFLARDFVATTWHQAFDAKSDALVVCLFRCPARNDGSAALVQSYADGRREDRAFEWLALSEPELSGLVKHRVYRWDSARKLIGDA